VPAGRWIDPTTGFAVTLPDLIGRGVRARVVLLGEDHDRAEEHRWQLHAAAALAGALDVVLGMEMLPRRAQAALDRWVAGESDFATFLRESDWARVWGFDPGLYGPLLDFARMHRVPIRGLNVSRALVARVAREGWVAVPVAEREGVSTPAPAPTAYRERLHDAWAAHAHGDFDRFVEAQLTWDRAMAEAIAAALAEHPSAVVVGLVGRGHLEHGDGVPRQLAAIGAPRPLVLVPWDPTRDCAELTPDVADAVFGVGLPTGAPVGDSAVHDDP
jgi:uncharacterized iron-regulated protein